MFTKSLTKVSTGNCSAELEKLENELSLADAVVVGAGAGMSVSAGLNYDGARFKRYFSISIRNMESWIYYSGGFTLMRLSKNTGRGGAATLPATVMTSRPEGPIPHYWNC